MIVANADPNTLERRIHVHAIKWETAAVLCSLYDAASRGPVFCESDGAAVHRPPRRHSNESDMALDGRDIALIAVACDSFLAGSRP